MSDEMDDYEFVAEMAARPLSGHEFAMMLRFQRELRSETRRRMNTLVEDDGSGWLAWCDEQEADGCATFLQRADGQVRYVVGHREYCFGPRVAPELIVEEWFRGGDAGEEGERTPYRRRLIAPDGRVIRTGR